VLAGHLAVAFGTKRAEPTIPLWALVTAVFWLDLLWPVLLLFGVESVRVNPGDTAFTNLAFDHYPWTHSLATALGWSVLAAVVGRAGHLPWRSSVVVGALVLSHWALDFITHRPDLPLWPGGPTVGLGLWNSILGTFVVEGGLYLGALWLYVQGSDARDGAGRYSLVALSGLIGLLWATQPWSPPPPSAAAVAWGALVLWVCVPWAWWIDRHRSPAGAA